MHDRVAQMVHDHKREKFVQALHLRVQAMKERHKLTEEKGQLAKAFEAEQRLRRKVCLYHLGNYAKTDCGR